MSSRNVVTQGYDCNGEDVFFGLIASFYAGVRRLCLRCGGYCWGKLRVCEHDTSCTLQGSAGTKWKFNVSAARLPYVPAPPPCPAN